MLGDPAINSGFDHHQTPTLACSHVSFLTPSKRTTTGQIEYVPVPPDPVGLDPLMLPEPLPDDENDEPLDLLPDPLLEPLEEPDVDADPDPEPEPEAEAEPLL